MSDGEAAQRRALEMLGALKERRLTAEMSHTARIALERLAAGAVERGAGKAEIGLEDLEAVKEALRVIRDAGYLAPSREQGNGGTYQTIEEEIAVKRTPQTRGRK